MLTAGNETPVGKTKMANEPHKIFDIAPPSAQATSRPVIPQTQAPDPMVNQPEVAQTMAEPEPEIANIPVMAAPPEPAPTEPVANESGTIKPALAGAPAPNFADLPKFGELQPKVDAHPLFSGHKDHRVKIRRMPGFVKLLIVLLVLLVIAYLAIDAGLVRGASHLPFHIFNQSEAVNTPAINS